MSLTIKLAPEVRFDLCLSQEGHGALKLSTSGAVLALELVPLVVGGEGRPGDEGDPGPGVPGGGAVGQVLRKSGRGDYQTEWADPPQGAVIDDDMAAGDPGADATVWSIDKTAAAIKRANLVTLRAIDAADFDLLSYYQNSTGE